LRFRVIDSNGKVSGLGFPALEVSYTPLMMGIAYSY